MVQEYRITVHQKHRIVNVIALLLSLSLMLAFTACNRVKVPTSDEVKDEVEEEYELKFKLDSEDIAKDGSEAEWVFVSKNGVLQVTVTWSAKRPDKFKFDEEVIAKVPHPDDVIKAAEEVYGVAFELESEVISGDDSEAEWVLINTDGHGILEVTVTWYAKQPDKFHYDDNQRIPDASEVPPSENDDSLIKVGIINADPNESNYRMANDLDMKSVFNTANGYDAMFFYSLKASEQIAAAEKFIEDEVDYLLISADDVSGWEGVLEKAKNAGIKVILFDRPVDADESLYEALVISDISKEGEKAVDWLISQNLSEYNIVHLQGIQGSAASEGRSKAINTMVAAYGNWNFVAQERADWDEESARKIVESVIRSGEPFNVIYAENDMMAKGAVEALDNAGISHGLGGDVIIISFDCYEWALEEVLAGNWNYEGMINPYQASYIDAIIRYGTNEKVVIVEDYEFDARTITMDDINNYGI